MKYSYKTKGTCSRQIDLVVEDGILKEVEFIGGCDGNLKGITNLVYNMPVEDVIQRLSGIRCGNKGTSCPDQLTKALIECQNRM